MPVEQLATPSDRLRAIGFEDALDRVETTKLVLGGAGMKAWDEFRIRAAARAKEMDELTDAICKAAEVT